MALHVTAGMIAGCIPPEPTTPNPPDTLMVEILYPSAETEVAAGGSLRATLLVSDPDGIAVDDAAVEVTLRDAEGEVQAVLEGAAGGQGVYRAPAWTIPLQAPGGSWSLEVLASRGGATGMADGAFRVSASMSRLLHDKYGFWIEAPSLRGMASTLAAERGDASNGMIRLGGALPAAHILPSAWIDIQWRQGDFGLSEAEAASRFLLEQIGDLGASRVRSLGEPQPVTFKAWPGWLVPARGQLRYEQVEWLVFYAPEVDRTFALGTTVVMPPSGFQAPENLRRSFEIDVAWQASGVAPEPLPALLPGPVLVGPEMGETFLGAQTAIVLRWEGIRALAPDEFYEIAVDYAYSEAAPLVRYATRDTWLSLPPDLYQQPNCRIFNWSVRLMRASPPAEANQPALAISHPSLYSYLVWMRPPTDPAPFPPLCPNEQT